MGRFCRLPEYLFQAHRGVTAVGDVLFVRFSAFMLVNVAAMKYLLGEFEIC